MADGRDRHQWNHLSHVLAAIINNNPFSDEPKLDPRELNPYRRYELDTVPELPTVSSQELALMWCGQRAVDYFAELDGKRARR